MNPNDELADRLLTHANALEAIAEGKTDTLRILVQGNPHFSDDTLGQLLIHVVRVPRTACIRVLIDAGADVINAVDEKGRTPHHWAAYSGYAGVIPVLLQNGANATFRDTQGRTPLQVAKAARNSVVASILEAQED